MALAATLLDMIPKGQTEAKINGRGYKLKSFWTAKETIDKIRRPPMKWEKNVKHVSDKGLTSKIQEWTKVSY